jgi:hypothetical protein
MIEDNSVWVVCYRVVAQDVVIGGRHKRDASIRVVGDNVASEDAVGRGPELDAIGVVIADIVVESVISAPGAH